MKIEEQNNIKITNKEKLLIKGSFQGQSKEIDWGQFLVKRNVGCILILWILP